MDGSSTLVDDFGTTDTARSLVALAGINFFSLDPTEIVAAATHGVSTMSVPRRG
jgi:hypothetical protein